MNEFAAVVGIITGIVTVTATIHSLWTRWRKAKEKGTVGTVRPTLRQLPEKVEVEQRIAESQAEESGQGNQGHLVERPIGRPPTTTQSLREDGLLLGELASVFDTEAAAVSLLERAGVPRDRVRPFGHATPVLFWESVWRELKKGLPPGRAALVHSAAELYPNNEVFQGRDPRDDETICDGDDKIQALGSTAGEASEESREARAALTFLQRFPTAKKLEEGVEDAPLLNEFDDEVPVSIDWHEDYKSGDLLAIRILNNTDSTIVNPRVLAGELALWNQSKQRFDHDSPSVVYLTGSRPVKPYSLAEETNRRDFVRKLASGFSLHSYSSQYPEISLSVKGIWRVTFKCKIEEIVRGWYERYLYFGWNPDEMPELFAAQDPRAELAKASRQKIQGAQGKNR